MHIADSRTFKDNKGEEKQEQDASTNQEDDMNILATEDMEHVDCLEFTRPTICENLRAHKDSQLQALEMTILAGRQDTKHKTFLCVRDCWS